MYTGGKWKPHARRATSPPITHTKGKWKPELIPKEDDHPPPTFTGSKWVAAKRSDIQQLPISNNTKSKSKMKDSYEDENSLSEISKGKWNSRDLGDDIILPSYTKGN